jgi:myo-inositol-1(or 4)-monophosphatase
VFIKSTLGYTLVEDPTSFNHFLHFKRQIFSMEPMLNMALRAARKGAEVLQKNSQHRDVLKIEEKAKNDYVTEMDKAVEKEILYHLRKAYPDHQFIGEESGASEQQSDYQWFIDPIDGTTNFIYGIPHFAISIGCFYKGKPEHAVILDPSKQEEFTASRGQGAKLNGRRIRVSQRKGLSGALLATGIPFNDSTMIHIKAYLDGMEEVLQQECSGIRRMGAASLDLAYVAAGRLDGYWEMNLKPWDMAAGILLIQEAGGFIGDFVGGNSMMESGNIVCGNNKVFKPLLSIVGRHLKHV